MNTKRNELIICPKCHREYLPAEIFIPKYFFGKPIDIIRDVYGEILEFSGSGMDLNESYTCDTCNTTFNVTAKISFQIETDPVGNIDEEYTSKLKKVELF